LGYIERYGGEFPLWLAPEQIKILAVTEKANDYARNLLTKLSAAGLRCGMYLFFPHCQKMTTM